MTIYKDILVTICCVTYNHKQYIVQAIEGFLMQKTNFPLEIIICDDASTDGTSEIIKEYERKYSDLIRGVYQTENQYSNGLLPYPNFVWPLAKGKYIALCEGDDCWIDSYKLQKQVDFLEKHTDYIACAHESIIRYDESFHTDDIKCSIAKLPYSDNKHIVTDYSFQEVLNTVLFQSSTLVFRNKVSEFPDFIKINKLWDVVLFHCLGAKGKIHFLPDIMSIYRKHPKSLTMYSDDFLDYVIFTQNYIEVLEKIDNSLDYEFSTQIQKKIVDRYFELYKYFEKQAGHHSNEEYLKQAKKHNKNRLNFYLKLISCKFSLFLYFFSKKYYQIRRIVRQSIKKILIKTNLYPKIR